MRFLPLALAFIFVFVIKPAYSQAEDLFHDNIKSVAARFSSLNIPGLEKI